MPKHRFKVVDGFSGYVVIDTKSDHECWMSDGVDVLFTKTGHAMSPGSEYFRRTWERVLNENPDETLEAYFPVTWEAENRENLEATRKGD
jgi:hypothetical protein